MSVEYSRYNHIVQVGPTTWGLYNIRTGKLVKLNPVTLDTYEHATGRSANTAFARQLHAEGFLVDYDERAHIRTQLIANTGQTTDLGLVLCPTLSCNFACPYCFEYARPGMMDIAMQDKVVEFARKRAEDKGFKHMDLIWYGGEPLLGLDVIERLSGRLMALCENLGMDYSADIVTNGYLLDQNAVNVLEAAHVKNVQITLDGPTAEIHDATRHLVGGGPTFDRILGNLRTIHTTMQLNFRCNCHADNVATLDDLRDLLDGIAKERDLSVNLVPSYMDGELGTIERDTSCALRLDREDFAKALTHFYRDDFEIPRYRFFGSGCMATNANGFAIDDRGDIYICWEHMGDESLVVGNIQDYLDDKEPDSRIAVYDRFMASAWPGDDQECMDCDILPFCLGGCPHSRLIGGNHVCSPLKYGMDDYVAHLCKAGGSIGNVGSDSQERGGNHASK